MRVILLESIAKIGAMGEQVNVKAGFGRNFLIPKGKALPATVSNLKQFEAQRAELEKKEAVALAEAQKRSETLKDLTISLSAKTGGEEKLYGAITAKDIAEAVSAKGNAVTKHEVLLPHGLIRTVGEHTVQLCLHADVILDLKVEVAAELN
jgi:large subunit ribosomal protein L9